MAAGGAAVAWDPPAQAEDESRTGFGVHPRRGHGNPFPAGGVAERGQACRGCCWLQGAPHPPPCRVKLGHQGSCVCVRLLDGTKESALQTLVMCVQLHEGKVRECVALSVGA